MSALAKISNATLIDSDSVHSGATPPLDPVVPAGLEPRLPGSQAGRGGNSFSNALTRQTARPPARDLRSNDPSLAGTSLAGPVRSSPSPLGASAEACVFSSNSALASPVGGVRVFLSWLLHKAVSA